MLYEATLYSPRDIGGLKQYLVFISLFTKIRTKWGLGKNVSLQGIIIPKIAGAENNKAGTKQKPRDWSEASWYYAWELHFSVKVASSHSVCIKVPSVQCTSWCVLICSTQQLWKLCIIIIIISSSSVIVVVLTEQGLTHSKQALYNPRKLFLVGEEHKVLNVKRFVRKNKNDKEPKSIPSKL